MNGVEKRSIANGTKKTMGGGDSGHGKRENSKE